MNCGIVQTCSIRLLFQQLKKQANLQLLVFVFSSNAFAQPANDDPCKAITLTVTATCTYTTYTNVAASASPGVPGPGCANYLGGDVWFTVVVPAGGAFRIDTQSGIITDGGMAIYQGSCTGLTLISCDDDSSPNGLMSLINASGLTPGSTIWVRVLEYDDNNNGTFGICVRIPAPPGPGGICSLANPFCTSNTYTFPNSTNQPSLGGVGIYGCLLTTPNPVWYYMQVQSAGNITIGISQTNSTGAPLDVDFALWGPFTGLASGCAGLSAANNISCSYSIFNTETATVNNALAGQFYILLLTNFSNQPGTITFSQTGGTGTSNCAIVCNVTAGNNGPVCSGSAFNLIASVVPGATYAWSGPGGFTSTAQNPTGVIAQAAGPNTYTVTVTTEFATCSSTTVVTVNDLAITASASNANCTSNGTVTVSITGGTAPFTYNINGGLYQASNIFSFPQGVYTATVKDTTGCIRTAPAVTVGFTNNLTLQSRADTTICSGITVVLTTISNATTFNWTPTTGLNSAFVSSPTASPPLTIQYIVTGNLGTCSKKDTVNITVLPPVVVNAGPDVTIISGDKINLTGTVSNGNTFLWAPAAGLSATNILTPVASPVTTTLYTLTATNTAGCTGSDNVLVTVVPYCVKVKNAFTPNGDGINDLWEVYDQYDCLKNVTVHVFNRYGNKVFESRDYRNKWDGRYSGKSLPDATYYAVVDFMLITGRVVTIKTDLTILR